MNRSVIAGLVILAATSVAGRAFAGPRPKPTGGAKTFVAPYTAANDSECFSDWCSANTQTGTMRFDLEHDPSAQFWAVYGGGEAGIGTWVGIAQSYDVEGAMRGQRTFRASVRLDDASASGHSHLDLCLYVVQNSNTVGRRCQTVLDPELGLTEAGGHTIAVELPAFVETGQIWIETQLNGYITTRAGDPRPSSIHAGATVEQMSIQ